MKSTESDVCYLEVNAVFNEKPVELLEERTWTAGLRRTGNDMGKEGGSVLFGVNESTRNHFGHGFRYRGTDVA